MARAVLNATRVRGSRTWRLRIAIVRRWSKFRFFRSWLNSLVGIVLDTTPGGVTPFVILATARSGSTLLDERLSSNRRIVRSDGEIFHSLQRGGASAYDVIRKTYFVDTGHSFVGSKVLASQLSDDDLQSLLSIPGLRIVIIQRANVVRQYVSHLIAHRDRVWMQPVGDNRSDAADRRVRFTVDDLLSYRAETSAWYDRYRQMTHDLATLEVRYEDLTADLDDQVRRVVDFLGIGEQKKSMPTRMRRQNPEPLSELIENYEDVRRELLALGEESLVADLDA